ncbi:MAG: hypothetical protein ACE5K4_00645 [Candidatus Hydrothermarchaeota archaeon]
MKIIDAILALLFGFAIAYIGLIEIALTPVGVIFRFFGKYGFLLVLLSTLIFAYLLYKNKTKKLVGYFFVAIGIELAILPVVSYLAPKKAPIIAFIFIYAFVWSLLASFIGLILIGIGIMLVRN